MITVIGHGRSPEGRKWASRIDASRLVVRMWDWHWQRPDDYGVKYHYGVLEILPGITEVFWQRNQRTPEIGWLAYDRFERFVMRRRQTGRVVRKSAGNFRREVVEGRMPTNLSMPKIPDGTIIIDQSWRDIAWELGGRGAGGNVLNLTRGCAAACWALAYGAEKQEDVVLVGFDNVIAQKCLPTDEAFPKEYLVEYDKQYPRWRTNWYTPGLTTCGTHDISIELRLLQEAAKRGESNLLFAQDVWN